MTNLNISELSPPMASSTRPISARSSPASIGGNIGMNPAAPTGSATASPPTIWFGVKMVLVDGTIIDLGGKGLDAGGYDLLGLSVGHEGQLGIVTEATVRLIAKPEGARPVLFGFLTSEEAGSCVADIIASGIIPVAIEFMDKPAIEICEAFAKAGYPLDVGALLIVEVEGSEARDGRHAEGYRRHRSPPWRQHCARMPVGHGSSAHLEGPKIRLRSHWPHCRLYLHGWYRAAQPALLRAEQDLRDHRAPRPARRQ